MIDLSKLKKKKLIKKGVMVDEESLLYLSEKYPKLEFSPMANAIIKDFVRKDKKK